MTINARILFVLLAGLLLAGPVCSAQQNLERRIDRYIKGEMRRQKIPGISLAVLRRGKIAILRSYGLANVEHNIHVKPETVFQSGSIGKQFTAAGVMLLVQDGKLSLDDRITQYFPDAPETWQKITIRNMLNGTSGLGGFGDEVDLRRDYTEEQFLAFAKKSPLSFEPGTNWAYSNIAYVTLGILIHKITGKFYGDFLRDRIFRPLGMTTARIISEADIVPNRAAGYRLEGGEIKNQEWVSPSNNTTADGSLYLTIIDLAKWDAALYTDFPIKQSTLRQIYTTTALPGGAERPYGFGWHIEKVNGRTFAFHGGAWQGFKSFIGRFPEDKLTVIFFANSWETRDFKLARGLVSIFYPQLKLPPIEPIADEDEKVTQTIRRTLLQLSRSQADAEQQFTLASRTQFFPAKAKLIGSQLASLSIPVAVIFMSELVGHRTDGTRTFYDYLLTDYTKSFLCTVEMTEGKVSDIELSPR